MPADFITRNSIAKLLNADSRLCALRDLPVAARLKTGTKTIDLFDYSLVAKLQFKKG